jgi:hypothetical protein
MSNVQNQIQVSTEEEETKPFHGELIYLGRYYESTGVWKNEYYYFDISEEECVDDEYLFLHGKCFMLKTYKIFFVFYERGFRPKDDMDFRDYYAVVMPLLDYEILEKEGETEK